MQTLMPSTAFRRPVKRMLASTGCALALLATTATPALADTTSTRAAAMTCTGGT